MIIWQMECKLMLSDDDKIEENNNKMKAEWKN